MRCHIMDASIIGGAHAKVDIETKGQLTLYFDLTGNQWQPVANPPAGVTFTSGCANPHFVNHSSGS